MDSEGFWNVVRREAARVVRTMIRADEVGIFDSYDPKTHSVKLTMQPFGYKTGWIPIANAHVGNNFGVAIGPQSGDQFLVGFRNGKRSVPYISGRVYSDSYKPPVVDSGEILLQNTNFTQIFFDKNNNLTIKHSTGSSTVFNADGTVAHTSAQSISWTVGGSTWKLSPAGMDITGGYIKHNGVHVDVTHTHGGVVVGSGNTGIPDN